MPELPEVEVVKKSLETKLSNLTIKKVKIINKKLRYNINIKKLYKLVNRKIISIKRRSKYLLINFDKNFTLLVHLGMTGKFFLIEKNNKKYKTSFYYKLSSNDTKHDHIYFYFNNKKKLVYNDVRKFGFVKIVNTSKVKFSSHIKFLGPEPLSKEFNKKYFIDYIQNKNKKIKDLLMDQKFVSGLGNIYCNEILFLSKINPNKQINKIKNIEIKKIIQFTKKILRKSIKEGGSSIKDFSNSDGNDGSFQQLFKVYGRINQNCKKKNCLGIIKKICLSNRACFFCPKCQR
tara:strand:- start:85 stop:951 length:867 start_codon:yes stop_codon:yes gene_type:complete